MQVQVVVVSFICQFCQKLQSNLSFATRIFGFISFLVKNRACTIHVSCGHGEAKFWIEPGIALARNFGLTEPELRLLRNVIEEHIDEIKSAWDARFGC
jgi:hypothetical protein